MITRTTTQIRINDTLFQRDSLSLLLFNTVMDLMIDSVKYTGLAFTMKQNEVRKLYTMQIMHF